MFEEFDHFFNDSIAYKAYVDGVFLEAYSKKEQHRIDKFLKENKFIEDPSKTTAEEKRKGYRRGTIETDITDKDGKKKRVRFELNPSKRTFASVYKRAPEDNYDEHDLNNYKVSISKKTASRKPVISNFILKHEEGHLALALDKDGKYTVELDKLNSILTRSLHKMFTTKKNILNKHDQNIDEFFADKYGNEHNKYKSKSKYQMSDSVGDLHIDVATKNAATGLLALMSGDTFVKSYMATELRNLNNASKKLLAEKELSHFREMRHQDTENKISAIKFSTKMLGIYDSFLKDINWRLIDAKRYIENFKKEIQQMKKGLDDIDKVYKDLASDLNNDLIHFKNKGKELSKSERKRLVKAMLFKAWHSTREIKVEIGLYGDGPYGEGLDDTLNVIHKLNKLKQHIKQFNEIINESTERLQFYTNEIKNTRNGIEKLRKEIDENHKLMLESIKKPEKFAKTLDSFKWKYDSAKARNKITVKQDKYNDISTMVRILMLLPDKERTAIVNKINEFMRYTKQYFQETFDINTFDDVVQESTEPIDITLQVSGGFISESAQLSIRCWRITHNGVGIYEALKKAMYETTQSTNIWNTFLGTPACGWLPKPPTYKPGDTSYFTEIGYKKFMSMTFPVVIEYINQSEIDVEEVMIPCDTITYADEYQFVANEISTVTENKLTTTERHGLQPEDFGVPELRKFPLTNAKGEPDEAHINAAVKMFPNCPFKYRKQLALNILKFADKLNMDTSGWKSLAKYKE